MTTAEGRSRHGYPAAARANLADFQDRLLSVGIAFFGVDQAFKGKYNAPSLWKSLGPIISCPPDRPVTRYGSDGDGGKLLCKLPQQSTAECVIYSLGSNGEQQQAGLYYSNCAMLAEFTLLCTALAV
jgi:hypothetical protein